ncbi:MAG TPA: oligoribonuclease [Terriglobales bacterium]|nr:oligoribonuclease [Terriglobales bacterium]
MPKQAATRLVWMDMEMSGLDPDRDVILEIATVITTNELELVAEGPAMVIHQSRELLDGMDDWNREHHGSSGLSERVLRSKTSVAQAERKTLTFLKRYCRKGESPLCGNSIHQDRRFLARHMPQLESFFHYRNIDVSTIKELVRRWYPRGAQPPEKKHAHLALDDIRESIDELQFYRHHYFVPRSSVGM